MIKTTFLIQLPAGDTSHTKTSTTALQSCGPCEKGKSCVQMMLGLTAPLATTSFTKFTQTSQRNKPPRTLQLHPPAASFPSSPLSRQAMGISSSCPSHWPRQGGDGWGLKSQMPQCLKQQQQPVPTSSANPAGEERRGRKQEWQRGSIEEMACIQPHRRKSMQRQSFPGKS